MEFKQIENKYWNQFYAAGESAYRPNRDLVYHYDFKGPMLNLPKGSKILELACGARCDGIELAQAGHEVYETDIAESAVAKAIDIYQRLGLRERGRFLIVDAENLPFEDNFFDAAFIAASFHHLPNPLRALSEMRRVAKPGGCLILGVEPSAWPYYTVFVLLRPVKKWLRRRNKKTFHSIADDTARGFTKKQLIKLCRRANWQVIAVKRAKYLSEFLDSGFRLSAKITKIPLGPPIWLQRIFAWFDARLSRLPPLCYFNWHWSVIAKK